MAQAVVGSGPAWGKHYRIREFAELSGVTVKALLHYDRLALLRPARTPTGHRTYSLRDLERLRRIQALKRVGVTLTRMLGLLDADSAALAAHLRTRRDTLAKEQRSLARAERAIALVEESLCHTPADNQGLSRLADVFDMPQELARMRRYFGDDAWEHGKRFYEAWPTEPWIAFCRDVIAVIPEGPGTGRARDLLYRWNGLARSIWENFSSDSNLSQQLHEGFARAWRDRENWPDTVKRRFADYRMDDVASFIGRVSTAVNRPGLRDPAEHTETA